jgi:two-component system, chemotaxis family, protein-glutamate methylesterase/glutaminase
MAAQRNGGSSKALGAQKIVVIGGSAGAVPVLQSIVRTLSRDIPAAVFIVLHLSPDAPSLLAEILQREGGPKVMKARDYEKFEMSTVYVATPDCHLQIADGHMRVHHGPRENRHRPAIDPLFRTAARQHGDRVLAVLLSGMLDDGVAGLQAVKHAGGQVIVLDPTDTQFPQMPENAIRYDHPDHVLGCDEIGPAIERLVREPIMKSHTNNESNSEDSKKPSGYMCPDCGGSLFEVDDTGGLLKFRCRVGHAYSLKALLAAENDALESALWAAVRSLEENAELKRRAASGQFAESRSSRRLRDDATDQQEHAKFLRELILGGGDLIPKRQS